MFKKSLFSPGPSNENVIPQLEAGDIIYNDVLLSNNDDKNDELDNEDYNGNDNDISDPK